jgi:hypothetical protein
MLCVPPIPSSLITLILHRVKIMKPFNVEHQKLMIKIYILFGEDLSVAWVLYTYTHTHIYIHIY